MTISYPKFIIQMNLLMVLLIINNTITPHVHGKSFFTTSPLFHPTAPPVIALHRPELRMLSTKKRSVLDCIIFGGHSTKSDELARYFLPFGKKTVLCGELGSQAVREGRADIIANYFGVLTSTPYSPSNNVSNKLKEYTFESILTFEPTQVTKGFYVSFRRHLSEELYKGWWVQVEAPFVWIRNNMHISEDIITAGGPHGNDPSVPLGYAANMKEAFTGNTMNWRFGRIKGAQEEHGLADISVRIGYTSILDTWHHFESYGGVIIPTGNKPKGEFVFEPIVGNHQQFGGFFGTSVGFELWSGKCNRSLYWQLDTSSTFFSSVLHTRSFDLKNNIWSRYAWVYRSPNAKNPTPGINVFTHLVEIEPGSTRNLNTAYTLKNNDFITEVGYQYAARAAEKLSFVSKFEDEVGIAAIIQNNKFIGDQKVTRNHATINEYLLIGNDVNASNQETYKILTLDDLDLESGSSPSCVTHTMYATIGRHWSAHKHPRFFSLGGAYEYSPDNTALSRWYLWGMFSLDF